MAIPALPPYHIPALLSAQFRKKHAPSLYLHLPYILPQHCSLTSSPTRAPYSAQGSAPEDAALAAGPSLRPSLTAIWRASSGGQPPATQLRMAGFHTPSVGRAHTFSQPAPTPPARGALTPPHSQLPSHPQPPLSGTPLAPHPHTP